MTTALKPDAMHSDAENARKNVIAEGEVSTDTQTQHREAFRRRRQDDGGRSDHLARCSDRWTR